MTIYRAATLPNDHTCMTCLRRGTHAVDCADQTSQWDLVRRALVTPTVDVPVVAFQEPAEARTPRAPMPVWPVAVLLLGLVLMALGTLARDPIAVWIWGQIHG